jgi:thiamine-monophosphate kinase
MSRDEFEIIKRWFTRPIAGEGVVVGIGDDAAVLAVNGLLAVTTDTLVEGVHVPRNAPPDVIGYRLMAVNLSDLAAMAAAPRWGTLALTLPEADERWLEGFASGLFALAERYEVQLVGGNLTRGPLTATLQLLGMVEPGRMLRRSGAHPGDDVYVTGSLGDGAAGLQLWMEGVGDAGAEHAALKERFLHPQPRVAEGLALGRLASAAIDVSDGLLADLGHLCAASGCGALIDVERLPLSAELLALFPPNAAQAWALAGGDDYELCFTASPAQAQAIDRALEALGTGVRRIGRLVSEPGVVCRRDGVPFAPAARGYKHFSA